MRELHHFPKTLSQMKNFVFLLLLLIIHSVSNAQIKVDVADYDRKNDIKLNIQKDILNLTWRCAKTEKGKISINLENNKPLIKSFHIERLGVMQEVGVELNPAFLLTVGKRDLVSQNGWNIFFDRPNKKPKNKFVAELTKNTASVRTEGSRTIIKIGDLKAGSFTGYLEITLYNGSPLLNIAAVMSTDADSTAILYDAGLLSKGKLWKNIAWRNTEDKIKSVATHTNDSSTHLSVKYRTIMGQTDGGCLAIFPAPHQYFYPLDEAFNLNFTWFGTNYRNSIPEYGMGIRQDLNGDNRWVPWFNAPPKTQQRLNFYCLLSAKSPDETIEEVKKYTHSDSYKPLPNYKTMSSHFHNEYVMKVLLAKNEIKTPPNFINVFKNTGIDIVHLAEFHYTAHPKGPDSLRLLELKTLHEMCKNLSDNKFLLLPGEEPNEFFGGHWLSFFPKPVNWIMSRESKKPFMSVDSVYGKVYRIANKTEMLKLLELENGLAWTAHARTKGSTGFPNEYREEDFFKSDRFFGAAWKNIPADLSVPKIGKRVLDLMDDMANWGLKKHVIGESDLFTIEPENEMYAHLNVNYLQMDELPKYKDGWQPVLDVMGKGKFFVSTGEVLLPKFTVNGVKSGETLTLNNQDNLAEIIVEADWTFPLNFAEIVTGDGVNVFRDKIKLDYTKSFGRKTFTFKTNLKNKKWLRVELWDVAANGAFTQQIWIK